MTVRTKIIYKMKNTNEQIQPVHMIIQVEWGPSLPPSDFDVNVHGTIS